MTNWNVLYDCLRAAAPELELRRDEPMNRHTSFKVGGPAADRKSTRLNSSH